MKLGTPAQRQTLEGTFARLLALRDGIDAETFSSEPTSVQEKYLSFAREFVIAADTWEEAHAPGTLADTAEQMHRLLRRHVKTLVREASVGDVKDLKALSDTLNQVSGSMKRIIAQDLDRWTSLTVEEKQDSILREVDRWTREEQNGFLTRLEKMIPKLRAV